MSRGMSRGDRETNGGSRKPERHRKPERMTSQGKDGRQRRNR